MRHPCPANFSAAFRLCSSLKNVRTSVEIEPASVQYPQSNSNERRFHPVHGAAGAKAISCQPAGSPPARRRFVPCCFSVAEESLPTTRSLVFDPHSHGRPRCQRDLVVERRSVLENQYESVPRTSRAFLPTPPLCPATSVSGAIALSRTHRSDHRDSGRSRRTGRDCHHLICRRGFDDHGGG